MKIMLVAMCIHLTGFDGNGISYDQSSVIYEPLGEKVPHSYSEKEFTVYNMYTKSDQNPLS